MDFGLGLVLSFTDNATTGINNAVNSLNNLTQVAENASTSLNQMASLSALSVVSNQLGSSFLKAGKGIMGMFSNILSKTQSIGSEFEDFDVTLTALFGGAEEGAKKSQEALGKLFDFAKKSPLEVIDVKDMIVTLQSQGINAFDETTGAISGTRQEFLAFLTDLKSFKPEVPTGRFKMAIQNYIGSGEKKMMRTVFDMGDIEDIIGHGVSDTVEGRMQDIVEMVEKKGLTGLSEKMSTTWRGVASNISDAFTQIYYSISSNGVFDKLKNAFMSVANTIIAVEPERLQALGKTLAEGLNIIVEPITIVANKLSTFITSIINLCETNPSLVKLGMTLGAVAGSILMIVGVLLKVTSALSGISILLLATGNQFKDIGGLIKTGSIKILSTLLPLTVAVGLMYLAWKKDFAGIRTSVNSFVSNLQNSFKTARQSVSGSIGDLKTSLSKLNNKNDFFSNITRGIMKVMVLGKALSEAWNGYTLSEDTYLKAKELGILPLIEAILDLKYRFGFFKQGFIDGWKEISDKVKTAIKGFTENIKGTALETLLDNLTEFLGKLASGDTQAWYDFGKSFADFTASALAFTIALKGIEKVLSVFAKLSIMIRGLSSIGNVLGRIGSGIVNVFSRTFPYVTQVLHGVADAISLVSIGLADGLGFFESLEVALTTAFTPLAGVVSLISGIAMAVTGFVKQLIDGFSPFWEIIKWIGIALGVVGAIILGAPALIATVVGAIIGAVTFLVVQIKDHWQQICDFFSTIASWINTNVIQPVVNLFMTYIFPYIEKIGEIVAKIIEIVCALFTVFVNFISTNVVEPVKSKFSSLWEDIKSVFNDVADWFGQKFSDAVDKIKEFFSPLAQWFSGVWEEIVATFNYVGQAVGDAISGAVKTAVNGILSGAGSIINGFISALNGAIGVINGLPGVSISTVSPLNVPQLAKGGVIDKPTLSIIGEAGKEAVVPLENNTEWISSLADRLASNIGRFITPINNPNQYNTTTNTDNTSKEYLTTHNTSHTIQGDTDNSVTFNQGSIQINVQNASEEEAVKLAKTVMAYIKRQQEIDRMVNYG